jgi:hypothetical protein
MSALLLYVLLVGQCLSLACVDVFPDYIGFDPSTMTVAYLDCSPVVFHENGTYEGGLCTYGVIYQP